MNRWQMTLKSNDWKNFTEVWQQQQQSTSKKSGYYLKDTFLGVLLKRTKIYQTVSRKISIKMKKSYCLIHFVFPNYHMGKAV